MAISFDKAEKVCRAISRQVTENIGTLNLHFILHHEGQQMEAMSLAGQAFSTHPAGKTALQLIKKPKDNENSRLLGTAVSQERLLLGLFKRETFLTLCSLNIDRFDKLATLRREAYHMAWHAMDTARYSDEAYRLNRGNDDILIRKRNTLQMTRANLQADTFSTLISYLQGDKNAITELGKKRAYEALSSISQHHSDLYPFPLATEITEFATAKWRYDTFSARRAFVMAEKMTRNIVRMVDDNALRNWLIFSDSAQDMAWRGFSREEILSAAINTSENTNIRSIAYLTSELTGIEPDSVLATQNKYSAFCDDDFNAELHHKIVIQVFEDVITKGIARKSAIPFIEAANLQNIHLLQGQTVGWCATALHDTARTFEQALNNGYDLEGATRTHFEKRKDKTPWDDLDQLGKDIVKHNRQGDHMTLEKLQDLVKSGKGSGLAEIGRGIDMTINSPAYQQQLAQANELNIIPAQPAGPALKAAPKVAPQTPAVAAPVPGLGGRARPPVRSTVPPTTTTPPADTQNTTQQGEQQ